MYFKFPLILSSLLALATGLQGAPSPSTEADLICHTSDRVDCYPRVFEATSEFQIIHEDQEIPKGLHVRLDLETGLKQAKLNDGSSEGIENTVSVIAGEEPVVINSDSEGDSGFEDQLDSFQTHFQKALNSEKSKNHGAVKPPMTGGAGDNQIFTSNTEIVYSASLSSPDASTVIPALENLEDLSHDIYWGLNLAKSTDSVQKLNTWISLPTIDTKIRSTAALLLGTAVQNNPAALTTVLDHFYNDQFPTGPLETVLTALVHEQLPALQTRLIYLLSELCQDASQLQKFLYKDGLDLLRTLFDSRNASDDQTAKLRQKISNFVLDHLLQPDSLSSLPKSHRKSHSKSEEGIEENWVIVDPNLGGHVNKDKGKAINIPEVLSPWCSDFKTAMTLLNADAHFMGGESETSREHIEEAYLALDKKLETYGVEGCIKDKKRGIYG